MQTPKKRTLAFMLVSMVIVLLLAACGADAAATPAAEVSNTASAVTAGTAATEDQSSGDAMAKDADANGADAKDGDAKDADTMAKDGDSVAKDGDAMAKDGGKLALRLSGVQPLGSGFHYEGWAIIDGTTVTTGKFNVDSQGNLVNLAGELIPGGVFQPEADLDLASAIVITIEPSGDDDTSPAETHYLAGDVSGGAAVLSVGHGAALGHDFLTSTGSYILATPTDGPDTNEKSGIWFLDLSSGSPAVGLELPALPDGWTYEGWAVIDGVPVSTGRFTALNESDLDAPYSGPEDGPPFPGEDFLTNGPAGLMFPVDLSGGAAVISVEPSPDDAASPFTLKPLFVEIPSGAEDHVTYPLGNNAQDFPSGTVTIG